MRASPIFSSRIGWLILEDWMKRLDQLTFTRFIAIVAVLFFHGGGGVYLKAIDYFPLSPILISATTSVTYLYVLSGFVMSLVYYRPQEKFNKSKYWTGRFVRLYPLYLLSFLLVCYYYSDSIAQIKLQKTLANVFILQAWIPQYAQSFNYAAWSMTVEFFFYALFPFFTVWAYHQSTKKLIWISVALWVATQVIHNILWVRYFPEYENFLVYFPVFHLSSFVLGAVGGIWYLREGREHGYKPRVTVSVFVAAVLLVCVYIAVSSINQRLPRDLELMTGMLAPILAVVIIALAVDKSRLSTFLNRPALVTLGDTSYGLYILHVPVIWIYQRFLQNLNAANAQQIFDITFLPFIVILGLLIHFYIDQPFREWLRKILQRVSMPLLFLDLGLVGLSIYLSFRLRINLAREYDLYRPIALTMFWSAFTLRTIFSVGFNAFNPSILYGSFTQLVRPVVISVTAGTFALAIILFAGYSLGAFHNFPRSILIVDWIVMLGLSVLIRLIVKRLNLYPVNPQPA
jgi:peptidoglycan/LPS O-acetylase OafA/YrhL